MNLDIFKIDDPSGKMSKESYVFKNFNNEYEFIISQVSEDIPFKEKVYLVINGLKEVPTCQNLNCDNKVKFKNSTLGYKKYCSNRCIGTDPNIIDQKKQKSLEKFGTETPAESEIIKIKIISTNQMKYGGNSAMSCSSIKAKSKQTLLKNWGVDNPSKSEKILKKRTESFKSNIETYKKSYEQTSLERYGVKHPWMSKEIHDKSIEKFYEAYKNRIISLIDSNFEFLKFERGMSTSLKFHCNICDKDFKILTYQFHWRINNFSNTCTECFPISENSSISQIDLFNFINNNYDGEVILNDKNFIKPYELDVYLPNKKIGFEFNGVFWHSDKFKDKNYHKKKFDSSENQGIKLYTIWEDDWNTKRDICKSFILNKLGKSNRVMARKTIVKNVDYTTSKSFLDENHLQGDCKSSVRLGLYFEDKLISLMTFSKLRLPLGGKNQKGTYELTRFCNKNFHVVIGGASKLLKFFIDNYNPLEIQTYSDNLISSGDLYKKLNFDYIHTSEPGYWYVIDGIRSHRFNWRKQKLVSMGYDKTKTEEEIMNELNYFKIYNGGNKKWVWKSTN